MAAFIQSPHYYRGRQRPLRLIVWHDMEVVNGATAAENVARNFADPNGRKSSAHVCVDLDSEVECVKLQDTAWHAPGANADGCGIELAGYARQSAAEWASPASEATLRRAAVWVASKPELRVIPVRFLTDAQLADRKTPGHTTHAQVSRVFKLSTHTDPGPNFPAAHVLQLVSQALNPPAPPPPVQEDEDMKPIIFDAAGGQWVLYNGGYHHLPTPRDTEAWARGGAVSAGPISDAEHALLVADAAK